MNKGMRFRQFLTLAICAMLISSQWASAQWSVVEKITDPKLRQVKLEDLAFADFNGDGLTDILITNGSTWQLADANPDGGLKSFRPVTDERGKPVRDSRRAKDLLVGDFNGDKIADICCAFPVKNSRTKNYTYRIKYGAQGPWAYFGVTQYPLSQIKLGDFNGDGRLDILRSAGGNFLVCYTQKYRQVSKMGSGWQPLSSSNRLTMNQIRLGDFNGDKVTDIFWATGSEWKIKYSGKGQWKTEGRSIVKDVLLGDFDADGTTDLLFKENPKAMLTSLRVAYGGQITLKGKTYNKLSFGALLNGSHMVQYYPGKLSDSRVGEFNGDGITDLFRIIGNAWVMNTKVGPGSFLPLAAEYHLPLHIQIGKGKKPYFLTADSDNLPYIKVTQEREKSCDWYVERGNSLSTHFRMYCEIKGKKYYLGMTRGLHALSFSEQDYAVLSTKGSDLQLASGKTDQFHTFQVNQTNLYRGIPSFQVENISKYAKWMGFDVYDSKWLVGTKKLGSHTALTFHIGKTDGEFFKLDNIRYGKEIVTSTDTLNRPAIEHDLKVSNMEGGTASTTFSEEVTYSKHYSHTIGAKVSVSIAAQAGVPGNGVTVTGTTEASYSHTWGAGTSKTQQWIINVSHKVKKGQKPGKAVLRIYDRIVQKPYVADLVYRVNGQRQVKRNAVKGLYTEKTITAKTSIIDVKD